MLASLSSALPAADSEWAFETKWDGYRAIVVVDQKTLRVVTRGGQDWASRFPELDGLRRAAARRVLVLDGEIVAPTPDGRTSFQRLQGRAGSGSASVILRRAAEIPVVYAIFDVLHDGGSLIELPWTERRARLVALQLEGAAWFTPPARVGGGADALAASRRLGQEGVVAKRLTSSYEPGRRSGAWLKVKNHRRQEFVIGAWTVGAGRRTGRLGALVVGYHDRSGRLISAGKVGTGYTDDLLDELHELLAPLRRPTSPFAAGPVPRDAVFVEPRMVGEVEFTEWTRDGTLRHPSFKGLRYDKPAGDVVREVEVPPP